jgi:dienelactone hydrolase
VDDDADAAIEWRKSRISDRVAERPFRIQRADGAVPGILWLPVRSSGPRPLVLLGHGGSGHKRSDRLLMSARWFVTQAGVAAMAIDGPFHGERVTTTLSAAQYQSRIAGAGLGTVLDRMALDWGAAVRIVADLGLADPKQLAYLGMSMGTRFGLPVVAAMGGRFRCVVFGKFGLQQCTSMHPALAAPERVKRDATRITAPTLFHVQLQDEIFHRDGQFALFDLLASEDKRLTIHPGQHGTTPATAIDRWHNFIVEHLA